MVEDDLAAVASASGQLGFLQQLTNNREVLRAAASRLKPWPQAGSDGQQPPMSEYVAKAIDVEYDRDALEIYVQALLRESVPRRTAEIMVKTRARTNLERANTYTRNTLRALDSMVRAVSPMPGRKLAFFLSDGFLLSRNDSDISDALRDITDAAVRAGVVLYTMDTRGLATDAWLDASGTAPQDGTGSIARVEVGAMTASQEALHVIAEQTGGRAILNTNAPAAALTRTVNETAAYYLLAWRPSAGERQAAKFRHLDVTVKGRPELTVLVQRGFLEGTADAPARKQSKQAKQGGELSTALAAAVPVREVPATLSVGYELADKGEALVTALVSVPLDALGTDASGKAAIEVAGYVVNLDGKIGARFAERLSVTTAQSTPGPDGRGYVLYRHQVKVAPGLYQIRAAALDVNSGRAGSAAEWIEIPDLKTRGLTLGTLKVGERPADTSQPYNVENFVAQRGAGHRFKRDTPLRLMTYIYNAQGARPDLEAQVQVLRVGSPVLTYHFDVDPGADPAHGIAFGAEIPLDALAPGRYVLQLTVTNRGAQVNASGRTLFTVE